MNIKTKKYFKISLIILIIIISISIIRFTIELFSFAGRPPAISRNEMEKEFVKNKDIIDRLAQYFKEQGYLDIYITSTYEKGEILVNYYYNEVSKDILANQQITEDIDQLFKKCKYKVIIKKNNAIYFQRWSNLDYGRGVVYSLDGELPQDKDLTILEPLAEKDWYFYEHE